MAQCAKSLCGMHNQSTNTEESVQPQPRFGSRVAFALPNLAVSNFVSCRRSISCCWLSTSPAHSRQVKQIHLLFSYTNITFLLKYRSYLSLQASCHLQQ